MWVEYEWGIPVPQSLSSLSGCQPINRRTMDRAVGWTSPPSRNMESIRESDGDSLGEMESSTSDPDSEFEAQFESGRQRKRPVPVPVSVPKQPLKKLRRRASVTPISSTSPSQGTPEQASLPGPVRIWKKAPAIRAEDIYAAIRSRKSATVTIVDEWIDSYKQDREAGLLVFVNFITQCCGCKGVVTREMFDKMQHAEIINVLTKDFSEESVHYPLSSLGPQWKRFRTGLCELMQVLVFSCQNSLLYDDYLFSSLLDLLTGLSDSQVRAFRHTSTLLAMKMISAVVQVGVSVATQLQTAQRRYDAESSKSPQDQATQRLEELQAAIKELLEHREDVRSLINAAMRGVFVHRYRDCVPDIRAVCIQELGLWLRTDPESFLKDGYLKYLGWTLFDKQSVVRLQCVRALQALYQERDFLGRLEFFTNRFKERMLTMVFDKEPDVAAEAVNLLLLIQQFSEEGLQEEECAHVYTLVFAAHRGLAAAAGCFLYHKLKTLVVREEQAKAMSPREAFFNVLITFFLQSECHDHGAYLVDSLWTVAGLELRDWETMTSLLLQDCEHGQGLSNQEEGALLELLLCTVRRAAQAVPPVGRVQGKRMLSMKDKKIQIQDKRRLSSHFMPLMPQLLAKYSADVDHVSLLLQIPLYFDLETYSSAKKLEKYLDLLLIQLCSVVEKHTDSSVLEACACLASALCSDAYTFSARADRAFSQLLDLLAECFNSYFDEVLQGTADEEDVYSASMALKRIAAFSSARDLKSCELFEPCMQLLKSGVESPIFEKELMVPALKYVSFQLMWDKVRVLSSTPTEAEVLRLKQAVRSFCSVSQRCLSSGQAEIRDQAFDLLCDLLLVYSARSVRSQPALQALALPPAAPLRSEMAAYLIDFIFTDDPQDVPPDADEEQEKKMMAALQNKRNLLAGYCKLVIYGVLDLSAATDVFKNYFKFYRDFGDIIKETLRRSRQISTVQSAKTVCLCLQQLFSEVVSTGSSKEELGRIRDLAKKLSLSFGIDLLRIRKALVCLHTDGIRFALRGHEEVPGQPPNLNFLEVLSEFSFKLIHEDRTQLVAFLKAQCPRAAPCWPLVRMYQRSLEGRASARPREEEEESQVEGEVEGEELTAYRRDSLRSHSTSSVAKRRRTSQQGTRTHASTPPTLETHTLHPSLLDLLSSPQRGAGLDSSSIHSNLPTPPFSSTVVAGIEGTRPTSEEEEEEEEEGVRSTPLSEEEFSSRPWMRKVRSKVRRPSSFSHPSPGPRQSPPDLEAHLTLLSLIEEDQSEEEPQIEEFDSSDPDSSYTLPSNRQTSSNVLDDLFD
ncbi:cohesin subunit SA-3 isoform X2 [Gadus chalcogrammus]|uniref:cohesin subunit SA-3 isoform X2 n=2 Tax=Gadus chalcogrammus TaxID=1042646 RepID=UPI0024C4CBD2|nr:cohesin subunit SA-3 isoform X2 [Gadus chalcogrammus]